MQEKQAKSLAERLKVAYKERRKESLKRLMWDCDGILVVYKDKVVFQGINGEVLFFHPDTAMIRVKSHHDPLWNLIGSTKKTVLDTTMGLASDSIVMAAAGHDVTAIESEEIPYILVSLGLKNYQSSNSQLNVAMRSIKTIHEDNLIFLKSQSDHHFDVVYCDPMFRYEIREADNLAGLASLANPSPLTTELLAEMKRVAKEKVIIKAHFKDDVFEKYGFKRFVRPNQKFHYGVIDIF
ncbi:class I SAM-dependent methyltransferase [Streptococcus sp. SQ9-PEA]|uniref:Class I SAM-dependent methyltransferase n=2 Tax=Streptococcus sciuri TaxID=2973939 RepID=A0ABT2F795_9STRE|nr:class I SAM-dependent methyltransferase [Streptococcus sciuri]MCS4488304.1 class I SAM-dependent methyltransferase [Streptococcus sciuri]